MLTIIMTQLVGEPVLIQETTLPPQNTPHQSRASQPWHLWPFLVVGTHAVLYGIFSSIPWPLPSRYQQEPHRPSSDNQKLSSEIAKGLLGWGDPLFLPLRTTAIEYASHITESSQHAP